MSDESRRRKKETVYIEGDAAAVRFNQALGTILSVSKDEMAEREAAYQRTRAYKDRPGPRPRPTREHSGLS